MKFNFNIPNKITVTRIVLIPLFIIVLMADISHNNFFAAFVFAMLSLSDFLDGFFARKKKQVTDLGKIIDPIADKLLISTAMILLVLKGYPGINAWIASAIIIREALITAIRIYLISKKIIVPASSIGKVKTLVQSIAVMSVLLKIPYSIYIMLAALVLTMASGIEILIKIKKTTGNTIINLPNLITLTRFLLIIPFVYYFLKSSISYSLTIFAIITLSDKLDGISARLMNQKTELGSGFDSFTDWTLIISTFALFAFQGIMRLSWFVLLIIPVIASGIIKMLHARRQKTVPVTFIARLNVTLTYITIIISLASMSYKINFRYSRVLLALTIAMAYITMILYFFKSRKKSPSKII